jgi:hypothetical protein
LSHAGQKEALRHAARNVFFCPTHPKSLWEGRRGWRCSYIYTRARLAQKHSTCQHENACSSQPYTQINEPQLNFTESANWCVSISHPSGQSYATVTPPWLFWLNLIIMFMQNISRVLVQFREHHCQFHRQQVFAGSRTRSSIPKKVRGYKHILKPCQLANWVIKHPLNQAFKIRLSSSSRT